MLTRGAMRSAAVVDHNRLRNTSSEPNLISETERQLTNSAPSSRQGSPARALGMRHYDFRAPAPVRPTDQTRQRPTASDLVNQSPLNITNLKALFEELKSNITNELSAQIDRKLDARLPESTPRLESQPSLPVSNQMNIDSRAPKTTAVLCDKFFGSANAVLAQEWVDIYEAVTLDWPDRDRVRALPRHLSDEALSWFSLEVVPNIQSISWTECRQRLIARFGQAVANPIVQATYRRLSPKESVSTYFNEKRRLRIQAGASEAIQVALLTSGMPESYQAFIASQSPQTTSDWIRIALLVEQTRSKRFVRSGETTFHSEEAEKPYKRKLNFKSNRFQTKSNQQERAPPTPCPICSKLGLKEDTMHWKRLCPRKDQENSTPNSRQTTASHVNTQPSDCSAIFSIDYVYIDVKVNGHRFKPFLDTGSKITGMSESAAKRAGLQPDPRTSIAFRQIDGMTRTLGCVRPRLEIGKKVINFAIHIFPNLSYDMLLGIDAAVTFGLKIDLSHRRFANSRHTRPMVTSHTLEIVSTKPSTDSGTSLNTFLQQFDLFSKNGTEIGRFRDVQHKIRLKPDAVPVYKRPYCLSPAKELIMRKIIDDLLEKRLIVRSNSPWASPMFLIPKKSNEDRPVVDYRPVNLVTIPEREPVPIVLDLIDRLSGAKFYSVLDIQNAYWQISLSPESREITSFITPFGQFHWTVLPFGLRNAVSAFQREIRRVLDGFIGHGIQQYLDDLIVYTSTKEEHFQLLTRLFRRLSEHGVKLRKEKCKFFQSENEFLRIHSELG